MIKRPDKPSAHIYSNKLCKLRWAKHKSLTLADKNNQFELDFVKC